MKISKKMDEFLDKVDQLCFEYGYEIYPTEEGLTISIIGKNEIAKVTFIDGDGRGK